VHDFVFEAQGVNTVTRVFDQDVAQLWVGVGLVTLLLPKGAVTVLVIVWSTVEVVRLVKGAVTVVLPKCAVTVTVVVPGSVLLPKCAVAVVLAKGAVTVTVAGSVLLPMLGNPGSVLVVFANGGNMTGVELALVPLNTSEMVVWGSSMSTVRVPLVGAGKTSEGSVTLLGDSNVRVVWGSTTIMLVFA